ncbi:phospholipase, partial [Campylobacter jejuni]|nr:phospholipase [Campylobacter jejuni]
NLKFHDNKGAIQVDLGYDIFNNGIYWYLQYFNGYGESLIDYNKHLQRLSTGFLISY